MSTELSSFDIEKAKAEIKLLAEKYEREKSGNRLDSYSEEQTKNDFILRLFKALGWDVYNEHSDTLTAEEKASKGHVDYGFRINGIPKFFLEAKSFKAGVDDDKFAFQAINYSWLKGCTWAILTNFETIKIYNAEWKERLAINSLLTSINCKDFLTTIDDLLLLTPQAFSQGLLDKKAEERYKKIKKTPIDQQLLSDLTRFREILTNSIMRRNENLKLTEEELDESVQRIIDRIIFIRTVEDRRIEPPHLRPLIREDHKGNLWKKLAELYRYFDDAYDSNLFSEHVCEKLVIGDLELETIINGLHETEDGAIQYDFSAINVDVLGNVYEQYLGHILKKTKTSAKIRNGSSKRKEQGIYYTPTYIVDYIVKNTIGNLTKENKFDYKKIKILDPACGSGSFLLKAFDYLTSLDLTLEKREEVKQELYGKHISTERFAYLKNNIFGVDLDPKAVEIAQLNLMLRATERKERLPLLQQNIKQGNSLIDDTNIAGNKAFKWQQEFKTIMNNGGFDVVIGNPPYVNVYLMDEKQRKFFDETSEYETPHLKYDLYTLFIEKGIKLLQNRGYLGFIVPYSFLTQPYAELLRKYILDNCCLVSIVDLSNYYVFQEASVKTIILILKKEDNKIVRNENRIKVIRQSSFSGTIDSKETCYIDQSYFLTTHQYMFRLEISKQTLSISDKMDSLSIPLGHICYISKGIVAYSKVDDRTKDDFLHDKKINSKCVPYLEGKDVEKYSTHYKGIYLEYEPLIMSRPTFPELHENKKILVRAMSSSLLSTFDDKGYYTDQKLICCPKRTHIEKYVKASKKPKEPLADDADKYDEKYIVGLLNSSLMWYYYKSLIFGGLSIHPEDIRNLPIRKIDFMKSEELKIHNDLANLVDKMLSLNKRISEIGDKQTNERAKIEEEIEKTDNEIDETVYKIYGITENEKKIIEASVK